MAIIRVNKTTDYTVMNNTHLKEKEMSLKAKGLLSLMLSLPDDWDYSISGLVTICKENETAVKSTLNELKKFGYLVVTKKKPNETQTGRLEYEYNIFEKPQKKQEVEKQGVEKQGVEILSLEFQAVENPPQLNTNILNTKQSNTKNSKKDSFNAIITEYAKNHDITERAEIADLLIEWLKVRKAKRAVMTDRTIEMNIEKLDETAQDSGMSVVDYLKEVVRRGWAAFFVIKSDDGNQKKGPKETVPNWCTDEYEEMVQNHTPVYKKKPKTVAVAGNKGEELQKAVKER